MSLFAKKFILHSNMLGPSNDVPTRGTNSVGQLLRRGRETPPRSCGQNWRGCGAMLEAFCQNGYPLTGTYTNKDSAGRQDLAYVGPRQTRAVKRHISRMHCWMTGFKLAGLGVVRHLLDFRADSWVGGHLDFPHAATMPEGTTMWLISITTTFDRGDGCDYFFATNESMLIARIRARLSSILR